MAACSPWMSAIAFGFARFIIETICCWSECAERWLSFQIQRLIGKKENL